MDGERKWMCRTRACGYLLGMVTRSGALRPHVMPSLIDEYGVAKFVCVGCQRVKFWFPERDDNHGLPASVTEAAAGQEAD